MNRKRVIKLSLIGICIASFIVMLKNFSFTETSFGNNSTRSYELESGNSIIQIFYNVPLNSKGIELPVESKGSQGVITISLYNSDNEGNCKDIIEFQKFELSELKNNKIQIILNNGFFNTYAYYAMEVKYEGICDESIIIPVQSNQAGYYANRWDTTGQGEMISASFLIKNYNSLLCVILILFSILLSIKLILSDDRLEVIKVEQPKALNDIWVYLFSFIILFLFLTNVICKETFYGDYQYFYSDNIEFKQNDDEIVVSQSFRPLTDDFIRLYLAQSLIEDINNCQVQIVDQQGNEASYIIENYRLNGNEYVIDVYDNLFSQYEDYVVYIKGEPKSNSITVDESNIRYQYKPNIIWIRVMSVAIGILIIFVILKLHVNKTKIYVSKTCGIMGIVAINIVFYLIIFLFSYQRYRDGNTWKYMLHYSDVVAILIESAFVSILCKLVAIKKN